MAQLFENNIDMFTKAEEIEGRLLFSEHKFFDIPDA
jgi:hypothetical protein